MTDTCFRWLLSSSVVAALLVLSDSAAAHSGGASYSRWSFAENQARATIRLPVSVLAQKLVGPGLEKGVFGPAQLTQLASGAGDYVSERVQVRQQGRRCEPSASPRLLSSDASELIVGLTLVCPEAIAREGVEIEVALLFEVQASHVHLLHSEPPGAESIDRALTERERLWSWSPAQQAPASFGQFLVLGAQHIASGLDHILFLVGLLLLSSSLRALFVLVTSFTLGHSISLALAVSGWVRPDEVAVEALIALSILALCAENMQACAPSLEHRRWVTRIGVGSLAFLIGLGLVGLSALPSWASAGFALFAVGYLSAARFSTRPDRVRGLVTFLFGLIHGLGFAGVLLDMELPRAHLLGHLLAFNLGVELGQLVLVVAVALLLSRLPRLTRTGVVAPIASMAIACVSFYWLGQRISP